MTMLGSLLIANRGEIACRIIRTAKRMGIRTIAVYSEADALSPHVAQADQSVLIGPAAAKDSYLAIDRLIAAAKSSGADAIHPGYGFLSERAAFVEACQTSGIVFVGPSAKAIGALGDKIAARQLAVKSGVPVVPGLSGEDMRKDKAGLEAAVKTVGYPVMIKAAAGGGGKGMRVVRAVEELAAGLEAAGREAMASFGDARVFVEKYIEEPRHIEIQLLGDQHGTVLHFGERECSIQRRHQKVIEEAPSSFVTPAMRAEMGTAAVALAKAAGYFSAGTAEFIVDKSGAFYFLEMNTRLQVEHPVTESVYGIDLVEWMLRIAAGEKLTLAQKDIHPQGHSIEARIYAEDPARGFMPATGRLVRCDFPSDMPDIRMETGVTAGSEITPFYDPMIAKIISIAQTREDARSRLGLALDKTRIDGVRNNVVFLSALLHHKRFKTGDLSTNLIADCFGDSFTSSTPDDIERAILMALAVELHARRTAREHQQRRISDGEPTTWIVQHDKRNHEARIERLDQTTTVMVEDMFVRLTGEWNTDDTYWQGTANDTEIAVRAATINPSGYLLERGGVALNLQVLPPHIAELTQYMPEKKAPDRSKIVLAPMPGLLTVLRVKPGEKVYRGQEVAVMEAMKMENSLKAEHDGMIGEIKAKVGDSMSVDQVIMTFA